MTTPETCRIFDPKRPCKKCGCQEAKSTFVGQGILGGPLFEHIERSCSRCGYLWRELPLDAERPSLTLSPYERLWLNLQDAALISGAWTGINLDQVVDADRESFVAAADAFARHFYSEGKVSEALRPVVSEIFNRFASLSRGQALQMLVDAIKAIR